MTKIDIAIILDERYIKPSGALLASLFQNNSSLEIQIHIFTSINKWRIVKLLNFIKKQGHSFTLHLVDKNLFENFFVSKHITSVTYYRFIIPEKMEEYTRCLYLDSDIIVTGDLTELWNTDLKNNIIGAVYSDGESEFNGGVMLMDIEKWNREKISTKLFTWASENNHQIRFWDQDALNSILGGHTYPLDKKWNQINENQTEGIIHFAGMHKPWDYAYEYPVKELFFKYLKSTPWPEFKPDEETKYYKFKQQIKNLINKTGLAALDT